MSENWFWVRDATTSADPEQIARAATVYTWAHRNISDARNALWATDSKLGLSLLVPLAQPIVAPQYMAELAELATQIGAALGQIERHLSELAGAVQSHSEYLGTAALIYSSAELDAQGYMSLCRILSSVGCAPAGAAFTGGTLLAALPGYVSSMKKQHPQSTTPFMDPTLPSIAGLEAQQQLAAVTQRSGSSGAPGSGVAGVAGKLAGLWDRLGSPPWAGTSGVVVAGAGGALWGGAREGDGVRVWSAPIDVGSAGQEQGAVGRAVGSTTAALPSATSMLLRQLPPILPGRAYRTPHRASDLLQRISLSSSGGTTGQVQVLRHSVEGSETSSWSVVIRGTQKWLPGTSNPQDMTSNLDEVAGNISDQHVSVRLAMELAGIKKGEAVEFVGHSQGGAVALSVAADPEVQRDYQVVSVLTAGAPTGPAVPENVSVLALENLADIVPALDGRPGLTGPNQQVIYFDAAALDHDKVEGAHSIETYVEAAKRVASLSQQDPRLQGFLDWEAQRRAGLGLGEGVTTEPMFFSTVRVKGEVETDLKQLSQAD